MLETIACIPQEFVLLVVMALSLDLASRDGTMPTWFQPVVSVEGWWKGCRQLFPSKAHTGLAVIAVLGPPHRRWRYSQLKTLPFGLGSSVPQPSSTAALVAAVSRRLLHIVCGNYMDDAALVGLKHFAMCSSLGASCSKAAARLFGVKYSDAKRQRSSHAQFLGHLRGACRTLHLQSAVWAPKPLARVRAQDMTAHGLATRRLT